MPPFQSLRVAKSCTQLNTATPAKIFPLLCPVREKDWIDGWEYSMVYSVSGYAEPGCVFTTPAPGGQLTTWYVNRYDPIAYAIEFVRMTPGEMVVNIRIDLFPHNELVTDTHIVYEYTSLSEEATRWLREDLDKSFAQTMDYWEKAINHYLQTGEMLKKN
jgi:hypothetical protein